MRSVFSKTWQQLTGEVRSLPEVLATAVARVNMKPATAFCTVSQESSQWISTATGHNGSQLQQPMATLDIPVANRPGLLVEMKQSLVLGAVLWLGSEFLRHNLKWTYRPEPNFSQLLGGSLVYPFGQQTSRHQSVNFAEPKIEPRVSHRVSQISTTELNPQSTCFFFFNFSFNTESH